MTVIELKSGSVTDVTLGETEARSIARAMTAVAAKGPDLPPDVHGVEALGGAGAEILQDALEPEVLGAMAGFRSSSAVVLHVKGLPLRIDVPTPSTGYVSDESPLTGLNAYLFGIMHLADITPYAVPFENRGQFVRNVTPVPSASGTTSSWGADVEFFWHTDNPDWPFAGRSVESEAVSPTFLAFTTVRNEERAPTEILPADAVVAAFADTDRLRRPAFAFRPPASNDSAGSEERILPILDDSPQGPRLRFDDGAVRGLDESAETALRDLRAVLRGMSGIELVLGGGDFLVFKNEQVLHRRRAFRPRPGGGARWLRRCYGL